jgi:type I restriction enzyme R subunit
MTVKTAAKGGFEVTRAELDWPAMDEKTRQEFEELFGAEETITVDPNALERKFTIPERNRAIVREFRQVVENGYAGNDGVKRFPHDGKTIVFAVTKRHAETLARMFDEHFADRKPSPEVRYADFVVSGLGNDDTVDGPTKIKRFKREEFPQIMVSVNMLDTGFDFPEAVNLVMARFTKSAILYRQMRGRGTRRADHIKKSVFTMFDFVGVSDFHCDDEDVGDGGIVIPPMPPDGPATPRTLLVLDVNDHIDPATREWVTVDEDGNLVRTEAGEARANELGLRFEAWLLSRPDFDHDQRRLLSMVGEQVRANAEAMQGFEAHHFVDPPFSFSGGIDRAYQLFGGVDGLKGVLDELNQGVFEASDRMSAGSSSGVS